MTAYEGLNLPGLMALMRPLALPEAVSMLPATAGWWVLLAWLLAAAGLVAWYRVRRWQRDRYRREALAALHRIEANAATDPAAAQRIATLLKQTALAAYPRPQVAALYGSAWADFLRRSSNDDRIVSAAADALAAAAYRPHSDSRSLCEPARRWIQLHRA